MQLKNAVFLVPINKILNSSKSWEIDGYKICIPAQLPDFIKVASEKVVSFSIFTHFDNSELDIFVLVSAKIIV